ncbi:hypothetical protein DFH27DRAFT_611144 [Peziza echinospora]|nr:hypothetical protein DFH27DRAFT_611144 [Peziza echinospora]
MARHGSLLSSLRHSSIIPALEDSIHTSIDSAPTTAATTPRTMQARTIFALNLAILAGTALAAPTPLPANSETPSFNAGTGPQGTASNPHGIGYPGDYAYSFRGEGSADKDLDNFNNQVYHGGARTPPPDPSNPKIPQHIAQNTAAKGFDEDLAFLDVSQPQEVPVLGAPELDAVPKDPDNVSGGQEIPACEIAAEFPEYATPKTFSTERVDYNVRTAAPTGGPQPEQPAATGEDNSNVAVYSDDKSFKWSGGTGEKMPTNDPQFKQTMGWISGKFRGEKGKSMDGGSKKKQAGKSRMSVFDTFGPETYV